MAGEEGEDLTKASRPNARVVVVSDRVHSADKPDEATPLAVEKLREAGFIVTHTSVVPEGAAAVGRELDEAIASATSLILTCGGTGLGPRNLTPEETQSRIETRLHGVEGTILAQGLKHSPRAGLTRGVVGLTSREPGGCLIVNAPSSRGGVEDTLDVVLTLWPNIAEWIL